MQRYNEIHAMNGYSSKDTAYCYKMQMLISQGGFPKKPYLTTNTFDFDGRYIHFGHIGCMLNYARWKSDYNHRLFLSKAEYEQSKNYINQILPENIELVKGEISDYVKLPMCPDVLNHVDKDVLDLHTSRKSKIMMPPIAFCHNHINNLFKQVTSSNPFPSCRELPSWAKRPYIVLHLRNAEQDIVNRNFEEEHTFQEALDFLGHKGINVIQIGKSRNQLRGKNLIAINKFSSEHDVAILKNCIAFIGSASGPSSWVEYLKKPSLLIDIPVPLSLLNMHVSSNTYILPKKFPTSDVPLASMMLNISDLQETGLLWWHKCTNIETKSNILKLFPAHMTRSNNALVVKNAVEYFYNTAISKTHPQIIEKHIDCRQYISDAGIQTDAAMLNPYSLSTTH
ncbi:hypothetical protein [Synechococcus sp. PROS-U-1]|uniref:hypothetical protein n=1 Tax=Synechococcus sp. PROS-U-1 TaxID=1400866 RepID=UPI001CA39B90|nr:hypothetical protein [Synechococcus sp. PROS-U-1]